MTAPAIQELRLARVLGLPLLGAALGALGVAVWMHGLPPAGGVGRWVRAVAPLLWPPGVPVLLGAGAGGFVGLLAGAASGGGWMHALLRAVVGALAGALAGLLTYATGYVAAVHPGFPDGPRYAWYLVEAVRSFTFVEVLCVGLGAVVGLAVARHAWRFQGVLAYIALVTVVAGYVAYTALVTLPQVPRATLPLSLVLFAAEAASLGMVVVYSFYNLDAALRKYWRRGAPRRRFSRYYLPRVAFQVPVYNEPPELVEATLRSILAVDYPRDRTLVMVLDDSTDAARGRLEAFCRAEGLVYLHRQDRRGFKAGALNEALRQTPEDVDLIAVVDADYQVEPAYLRETVGYFIEPRLGFLQTPQDYRNKEQSYLARQYALADAYFYRAVLPSRNEENAIIFCGTMGVLRRQVLEEVGGWGERYVTEDAELALRVLERGYDSLYIPRTYGRGLVPATYDAYKKQYRRWAFGGVGILKGHFKDFLSSGLSRRQKFDFLVGGIHWLDGVPLLVIAAALATMAYGELAGVPLVTHHTREIWLVGLVPLFLMVDGLARLHLALRRAVRVRLGGTARVLGVWFAIKFSNAAAGLKALLGARASFVRTPKGPARRLGRGEALGRALRLTRFETLMSVVMLGAAGGLGWKLWLSSRAGEAPDLTPVLLTAWCLFYAGMFLCAPYYAYKSYTTFKPGEVLATGRVAAGAG